MNSDSYLFAPASLLYQSCLTGKTAATLVVPPPPPPPPVPHTNCDFYFTWVSFEHVPTTTSRRSCRRFFHKTSYKTPAGIVISRGHTTCIRVLYCTIMCVCVEHVVWHTKSLENGPFALKIVQKMLIKSNCFIRTITDRNG